MIIGIHYNYANLITVVVCVAWIYMMFHKQIKQQQKNVWNF